MVRGDPWGIRGTPWGSGVPHGGQGVTHGGHGGTFFFQANDKSNVESTLNSQLIDVSFRPFFLRLNLWIDGQTNRHTFL